MLSTASSRPRVLSGMIMLIICGAFILNLTLSLLGVAAGDDKG